MDLWQHQEQAINYMLERKSALLMMGIATGKTRTVLEYLYRTNHYNILIIGTKNSMYVWEEQSKQFNYNFPILTLNKGTIVARAKAAKEFFDLGLGGIVVMNYEALQRKYMLDTLNKIPLDCIIFDEVHKLRGQSTKQSRNAYYLARTHPKAYRIGLTGTLIYNKPLDVFGIYRFIDPNIFGLKWNEFRFHYAIWAGERGFIPVKYLNQEEMHSKIEANAFIVDRSKVLDLPTEQHVILEAEFSASERSQYNKFNKDLVAFIPSKITDPIVARNILDKVNKLQQLTSGFIYDEGHTLAFSNAKSEVLEEALEEINECAVIFYKYTAELDIIKATCIKLHKSFFYINGYNSDYSNWLASTTSDSVLAVQIQSGSEGIDFTKAGIMFFYSLPYSYGQYLQALGRISRPNQKEKNILYYYILVNNSIDQIIWKALHNKKDLIEELIHGLEGTINPTSEAIKN